MNSIHSLSREGPMDGWSDAFSNLLLKLDPERSEETGACVSAIPSQVANNNGTTSMKHRDGSGTDLANRWPPG